jgi:hypothetical protein
MLTNKASAQEEYTTITKNINPEGQSLYHDLSPQGDSLYLKSESIFYKVTFLNSLDRKVYTFNPPVLEGKISLHDIIIGDYTVLVYKKDRIIVFHISRLKEIQTPFEMIASKNISINQENSIVKTVLPKVNVKEEYASKGRMNEIKMDENFELSMAELKVAINDDNLNIGKSQLSREMTSYNLSSLDRSNMETREEFRKNNLRPNGRPY